MTPIPDKLGVKTPADLVKNVPPMPKPKPERVEVPDAPDWKADVSLNLLEKIQQFFRSIAPAVSATFKAIGDVAKILAFIQTWWIPVLAVLGILLVLFVLRIF